MDVEKFIGRIYEKFVKRVKEEIGEKDFELALKKKEELGKGLMVVLHNLSLLPYHRQKTLLMDIGREEGLNVEDGENISDFSSAVRKIGYLVLKDGSTYSYMPVPPVSGEGKSYVVEFPTFQSALTKVHDEEGEGIEKLFMDILKSAVEKDVSDIHIRPKGDVYYVYFRWKQDFLPQKDYTLPQSEGRKLLTWIKNYAHKFSKGMFNPDLTTMVQDAKAEFREIGVTLRLSFMPSPNFKDETMTARVLRIREKVVPLEKLGYLKEDMEILLDVMKRRGGVFLFSGKTNSGKTTTISALLSAIRDRNVLTVEDPVEYLISNPNVVQHQVFETQTEEIKATFLDFARGFKRSDPDIVFVGEWRNDPELSKVIEELSLAGQLVLTTIHLPSAFVIYDAIPSMYGVSKEVLIRSVLFSINQVLVDIPCPECCIKVSGKEAYSVLVRKGVITKEGLRRLPYANAKALIEEIFQLEKVTIKGPGCTKCSGTGKVGITPIYEYLYPTEEFKEWVKKESPSPFTIEKTAIEQGLGKNKLMVFKEKVKRGEVGIEEVEKLR